VRVGWISIGGWLVCCLIGGVGGLCEFFGVLWLVGELGWSSYGGCGWGGWLFVGNRFLRWVLSWVVLV